MKYYLTFTIQYLIPCTNIILTSKHNPTRWHYLTYTIKHVDTRRPNISFTTTTYKTQHFSIIQGKNGSNMKSQYLTQNSCTYIPVLKKTLYFQEHKQAESAIIYLQANKTRTTKHQYKVRQNIPLPHI
jgi:hypothetical protein